jgi:hypothetical protein
MLRQGCRCIRTEVDLAHIKALPARYDPPSG